MTRNISFLAKANSLIFKIAGQIFFFIGLICVFFISLNHRQIFSEDCQGGNIFEVERIGHIHHPRIDESSGLIAVQDSLFWTHNDDTDSSLYLISSRGNLKDRWTLPFKNRDWEEITSDKQGNLYLGNFGNNLNYQILATIYKLDPMRRVVIGRISFLYEDHLEFQIMNPMKMNFDCEAMVHAGDSLYLFTKNKSEQGTNVYVLPDKPGRYIARKKQEIKILGMVTAASLRRDEKELALLTYGKVYFFSLKDGLRHIPQPDFCLAYWQNRQSESITYWGRDSLLMGNEQRQLFLLRRKLSL